jgi:hypothetical protein
MRELIRHIIREHIMEQKKLDMNTNDFVKMAKEIHGDKYDYSKTDYRGKQKKVKIICPIHGEFETQANYHLEGRECRKCASQKRNSRYSLGNEKFINRAKEIHGDKYNYDDVNYSNNSNKVQINCPIHGPFFQSPDKHLRGDGCRKCGGRDKTTEEFVKQSKEIHGDKYDYSDVDYKTATQKVKIICPIHGEFEQSPNNHLSGFGCKLCSESQGEKLIDKLLSKKEINFIREKTFSDCTNTLLGKFCRKLPFDFYLPNFNTCIEYDGEHHFTSIPKWGGDEEFVNRKKLDKLKDKYCEENGIKLIRIPYTMKKEDIEPYILSELGM